MHSIYLGHIQTWSSLPVCTKIYNFCKFKKKICLASHPQFSVFHQFSHHFSCKWVFLCFNFSWLSLCCLLFLPVLIIKIFHIFCNLNSTHFSILHHSGKLIVSSRGSDIYQLNTTIHLLFVTLAVLFSNYNKLGGL